MSPLGTLSAIAASLYSALFGYLVLVPFSQWAGLAVSFPADPTFVAIPALVGFVGCQIDSVFGATLERRGVFNKRTTNLAATSLGALIAFAMYALLR